MGVRENSCLASPWNLEGGYFQTPTQAVHREPHTGLHSPPDSVCCNSVKLWSLLIFSNVPQFGESCGFVGSQEPTWGPKTAITNFQAKARLSEGLAVTCSPLWSLSASWGPPVLPAPNPTLAGVPSAAHSATVQSWRLHLHHHLLFLELFIAIVLVIHTSGAAVRCIQMSANTLPGPDPNFSCLCKIFSSGLRPYLCS